MSRISSGGSAGFSTMIALPRSAPPTTSMARAVVSVNSSMLARVPGPADLDAIDATISPYATGVTRRDRGDDRHGRLPAAGHHVHVRLVQVLVQVDRRHHVRAERGRGQVDHRAAVRAQHLVVAPVRAGRGGVEDQLDVGELGQRDQPVDAVGGGGHAEPAGPGQAVGVRVDAGHRHHPQAAAEPQHLDHQVGADVAGTEHRHPDRHAEPSDREAGPHRAEAGDPGLVRRAGGDRHHRAERPGEHHVAGAQRVAGAGQGGGQPLQGVQRVAQAGRARARPRPAPRRAPAPSRTAAGRRRRAGAAWCRARTARWRRCRRRCPRWRCPSRRSASRRSRWPAAHGRRRGSGRRW